jgi:hypothetical protein
MAVAGQPDGDRVSNWYAACRATPIGDFILRIAVAARAAVEIDVSGGPGRRCEKNTRKGETQDLVFDGGGHYCHPNE